jgi:hypothetical protein
VGEVAVLSFTGSLKVCVALHPIDLRKSFNGLNGMVTERLGEDPRTGALLFSPTSGGRASRFCIGTGLAFG